MTKTLQMFEFGPLQEAMSRDGKSSHDEVGTENNFVRCQLGGTRLEDKTCDDLFGAMPLLEAKKALFASVAGACEKRREDIRW